MEQGPEGEAPPQYLDTDAIQNLDTARMALRWALERLQKLDRDKAELTEKAGLEERAKKKALEEYSSLQRTLALRANESDQRELYYAKLEEFLSLKLEGKIDLTGLAKRELEVERLRQLLDHKQGHLDKEYELKRANLDSDYRRLREEAHAQVRDAQKRLEEAAQARQAALEQDHLSRMAALHEKEARLKQDEKSFLDRQSHFEQYYREQRAQLQSDLKNLRSEIDDQVRFRSEAAERVLGERQTALEVCWNQEKALLSRELENWKRRCQELTPQVLELQTALALTDEAARKSQASSNANALLLKERDGAWTAEREKLSAQLDDAKRGSAKAAEESLRLQRALSAAEQESRQARSSLESAAAAQEAERKNFERRNAVLEAELAQWRRKTEDAQARTEDLGLRLSLADDSLRQAQAESREQLALAQERLKAARAECERLSEARKAEAQWTAQQSSRANELEQRVVTLEEELARSKTESAADRQRWLERSAFLERERQTLAGELAALRRAEEQALPKLMEADSRAAAAREAEAEALRKCGRLEQALASAASERRALEDEAAARREKLSQAAARIIELERETAVADDAARRLKTDAERLSARLKERQESWDKERSELERETDELRRRSAKKAELLVDLEKKLAAERPLPSAEPPPAP